jgi:leader peptidase (prepilin peptidase) / N-methyltransferase
VTIDAQETTASRNDDLHPNLAVLFGAGSAVALISAMSLPWPLALASTILGALMIAGAEVDARTYLLPDAVTWSAIALGILAAFALNPFEPWLNAGLAVARGAWTAAALALLRWGYARIRGREGLGFGDVKLAAAVGAWLPVALIPLCFALATCAALVTVLFARLRGESIEATAKLPFGAFLCPALWLVFYAGELLR